MRGWVSCASRECAACPWGISEAPRGACETLEGGDAPCISRLGQSDAGMWAHGCRWGDILWRTPSSRGTSCHSARIDKSPGGGPYPHHDAHRGATDRTAGRERLRGVCWIGWSSLGWALPDQPAAGRERDGTAGMEHAEVADFHASPQARHAEEPAEKLHAVSAVRSALPTFRYVNGDGRSRECVEALVMAT